MNLSFVEKIIYKLQSIFENCLSEKLTTITIVWEESALIIETDSK